MRLTHVLSECHTKYVKQFIYNIRNGISCVHKISFNLEFLFLFVGFVEFCISFLSSSSLFNLSIIYRLPASKSLKFYQESLFEARRKWKVGTKTIYTNRIRFKTHKNLNFCLTNMYRSKRKGHFLIFNFEKDEDKEGIKKYLRNLTITKPRKTQQ